MLNSFISLFLFYWCKYFKALNFPPSVVLAVSLKLYVKFYSPHSFPTSIDISKKYSHRTLGWMSHFQQIFLLELHKIDPIILDMTQHNVRRHLSMAYIFWTIFSRMFIQQTALEARDRVSPPDAWGRGTDAKFTLPATPWLTDCLHPFGLVVSLPPRFREVQQTNLAAPQRAALRNCLTTWNTSPRFTLK